jgi:hypothetical protein
VVRLYVGAFCTALNMKGVSLAVLCASKAELDFLDAVSDVPGWVSPLLKTEPSQEREVVSFGSSRFFASFAKASETVAFVVLGSFSSCVRFFFLNFIYY